MVQVKEQRRLMHLRVLLARYSIKDFVLTDTTSATMLLHVGVTAANSSAGPVTSAPVSVQLLKPMVWLTNSMLCVTVLSLDCTIFSLVSTLFFCMLPYHTDPFL